MTLCLSLLICGYNVQTVCIENVYNFAEVEMVCKHCTYFTSYLLINNL